VSAQDKELDMRPNSLNRFQEKAGAGAVNMRRKLSSTKGVLSALLAGTAMLLWSAVAFAGTPILGPDCGATGASIVGSDSAGKVTLGIPDPLLPVTGTCTLSFSVPYTNPPACTATNETNGGGYPAPAGARTTYTTMVLGSTVGLVPGDVVSYMCVEY
jgi:hypothetical protein